MKDEYFERSCLGHSQQFVGYFFWGGGILLVLNPSLIKLQRELLDGKVTQ